MGDQPAPGEGDPEGVHVLCQEGLDLHGAQVEPGAVALEVLAHEEVLGEPLLAVDLLEGHAHQGEDLVPRQILGLQGLEERLHPGDRCLQLMGDAAPEIPQLRAAASLRGDHPKEHPAGDQDQEQGQRPLAEDHRGLGAVLPLDDLHGLLDRGEAGVGVERPHGRAQITRALAGHIAEALGAPELREVFGGRRDVAEEGREDPRLQAELLVTSLVSLRLQGMEVHRPPRDQGRQQHEGGAEEDRVSIPDHPLEDHRHA